MAIGEIDDASWERVIRETVGRTKRELLADIGAVASLGDYDAVVPRHEGFIEPLAAVYHRHAIELFERNIAADRLKMSDALGSVRTRWFDLVPGKEGWPQDLFKNVNAPTDL